MNSGRSSSFHLPALDGVRGLAVLLVIASHVSEHFDFVNRGLRILDKIAFAGWTGVDLFFILSGFLITGILWDSKLDQAYFRNFYARRTLRIFPLYYFALIILLVLVPALPRSGGAVPMVSMSQQYWVWFAAYLVDVLVALKGWVFAGHFWTLAVEEHFYLLWPVLVYKFERRTLINICAGVIAFAFLLRAAMVLSGAPAVAIYVLTPCRMDGLALGALLALAVRGPRGLERLVRPARIVLAVTSVLWIGIMSVKGPWSQYGPGAQTIGYSVTECFYLSFLVLTLSSIGLTKALSVRALRFFGKISYALYVFHVPIVFYLGRRYVPGDRDHSLIRLLSGILPPGSFGQNILAPAVDALVFIALAVGLSVGAALISWYLLESPLLRLKRRFSSEASVATKSTRN